MSSFYVTLPSNVHSIFNENTISTYTTQLASTLRLEGKWMVGLAELSYTLSWFNINTDQKVGIHDEERGRTWNKTTCILEAGPYQDIYHLIERINSCLRSYKSAEHILPPRVEYNTANRLVTIQSGRDDKGNVLNAKLDKELCDVLGFEEDYYLRANKQFSIATNSTVQKPINGPFYGHRTYDINAGLHSIYVYCDIAQESHVGNALSPLIRVAHVPSDIEFGDQVKIIYHNIQYHPLKTQEISTINISLRHDSGEKVKFKFGRTIATLHFIKL